jgi:hypothetical protein
MPEDINERSARGDELPAHARTPIGKEEIDAHVLEFESALAAHRVSFSDVARCRFLVARQEVPPKHAAKLRELYSVLLEEFSGHQHVDTLYFCEHLDIALALTVPASRDERAIHLVQAGSDPQSAVARDLLFRGLRLHFEAVEYLPKAPARIVVRMTTAALTSLLGALDDEQARHGELSGFSSRASEIEGLAAQLDRAEDYYRRSVTRARHTEYVSGMAFGLLAVAIAAAIVAVAADVDVLEDRTWVATLGGAMGAVVSVLQRLTAGRLSLSNGANAPMVRVFGALRPLIGALFGLVAYVLLSGGLLGIELTGEGSLLAQYAALGFFAGFAERFAQDMTATVSQGPVARPFKSTPEPGVGSDLAYRLPATVEKTITSALRGPELIRWRGFIRSYVARDDDRAPRDDTGRYVLAPGRPYHVVVQLLPESSGDVCDRVVEVNEGASADEAPFTVTMVSDTVPFPPAEYPAPAPPGGASRRLTVPFTAPATPGMQLLWVQLRQQGRIVQMTPLEIVSDATG